MTPEPESAVVVPAILGVGLIFTLLTLAYDAIQQLLARRRFERRPEVEGRASGELAIGGRQAAVADRTGLRSQRTYLVVGAICLGLGIYLTIGAWANYFGATPWSENVAWLALLIQVAACGFGAVGVYSLALGVRYGDPPIWARPALARTALGQVQHGEQRRAVGIRPTGVERLRLLGTHHVTDRLAFGARLVAVVWSLATMSAFVLLAARGQIPQAQGGTSVESMLAVPLQLGLLVIVAIGLLLSWRWEAQGAAVLAVGGAALAVVASVQYEPEVAVAVSFLFFVPAFLHWLAWQRDRGVVHIGVLFVVTAVLVGFVWFGADRVYDRYFGPMHPESETVALPDSPVQWIWAGGTSSSETTVVARLATSHDRVRVGLAKTSDMSGAQFSPVAAVEEDDHFVVRASFQELQANTVYHYAVEVDGKLDLVRAGRLRTFPGGAADFMVAFSVGARTGSNGSVFDVVRDMKPLAYLQLGDFHYANIDNDEPDLFRDALDVCLSSVSQSALYRSTSTSYVWDDHDYSGNDANGTAKSRPAAEAVYRQYVPHYPLTGDADSGSVYQAFNIGRIRFLMTDTRSTRTPQSEPDDELKYMLGPEQEQWLNAELAAARDRDGIVVWANSVPWIDAAEPGADSWAGYTTQRERLADAVASLGMTDRLLMLGGDGHMVALDDGTNSDYSSTGAGGFPVLHAGALDRLGSAKGGPYSDGIFPGSGQFGVLRVVDDGGKKMRVTFEGRTWDGRTLVERTFVLRAGAATE
jgi:hypothetical protein